MDLIQEYLNTEKKCLLLLFLSSSRTKYLADDASTHKNEEDFGEVLSPLP